MQDFGSFLQNHIVLVSAFLLIFIALIAIEFIRQKKEIFQVTPQQATLLINRENATVIDIREKEAYEQGHIAGSQWISIQDIRNKPLKLNKYKNKTILLVDTDGTQSTVLANELNAKAYPVRFLKGGINEWKKSAVPLVKTVKEVKLKEVKPVREVKLLKEVKDK